MRHPKYILLFTFVIALALVKYGHAAVALDDFFPYGMTAGDQELPANDDGSTSQISISPYVFPFVDHRETRLWLNNNGDISFASAIGSYTPICGPLSLDSRMIAIFWTDIDTRKGGNLYYRQSIDRKLLQKAATDIIKRYPKMVGLNLQWLFIATWMNVGAFNGASGQNTFQLVMATDGTFSFALMYFNKIMWTNGNTGDGKVGFDVGDGKNFIMVDGSCTSNIRYIVDWSNMDEPGKAVFRVDNANISTSTCEDDGSYNNGREKLRVTPSFIDTLGHVPVAFQGPCFSETARVSCTFHDTETGPIQTTGIVTLVNQNTPTVYCQTPYFFGLGRTNVDITLTNADNSIVRYSAFLSVAALNPSVHLSVLLAEKDLRNTSGIYRTNHSLVSLDWNPADILLQNMPTVDVTMIWFDADANTMADLVTVVKGIPNSGSAQIVYKGTLPTGIDMVKLARSFVAFAISANNENIPSPSTIYTGVRLFTSYLPSTMVISSIRQHTYKHFLLSDTPRNLPSCPCNEAQARTDPNFVKQYLTPAVVEFFHPGAFMSYQNSAPILASSSGQQCVYDEEGRLMVGANFKQATIVSAGGTADKYSPVISLLGHLYHDLTPWAIYCNDSDNWESCRKYYEMRPSDSCSGYQPPRPSQGNGDPHITTFDGAQYTFNGAGEFVMVESTAGASTDFAVQARMEQFGTSSASVFTAFAMRQGSTRVQIQVSQTSSVDVLANGYAVQFNDPALRSQTFNKEISVVALADDLSTMLISMSSGISFVINTSPAEGVMAITGSSIESNKGKLRGLLGNFDGNPDNDYQAPDGSTIQPRDANLHNIHFDFAVKWMITETNSLFSYPPGKTYASYARPDFVPKLEQPDVSTMPQEAIDLCGSSMQCLFDYEATDGSVAVANLTLTAEQSFNETIVIVEQVVLLCEDISFPENGFAYLTAGILKGSQATFGCNNGYGLDGDAVVECEGNDVSLMHWTGGVPACILLQCPPIDSFENGQMLFSDGRLPGSVVHFTCHSDYELTGSDVLVCNGSDLATMAWQGDMPKCLGLLPSSQPWPRPTDLVAFWPLDTIYTNRDVSGNNRHGQLFPNVQAVKGPFAKMNTAMTPTSQNAAILTSESNRMAVNGSFTVSLFFAPSELRSLESGGIFEFLDRQGTDKAFQLGYSVPSSVLEVSANGITVGRYTVIQQDGVWTFIAVVFDASTRKFSIFGKHGIIAPAIVDYNVAAAETFSNNGIRLGYSTRSGKYLQPGDAVSCLMLYSAALTASEVRQAHDACRIVHGVVPCGSPKLPFSPIPSYQPAVTTIPRPGQFPWIASLRYGIPVCSASIIDDYWLLTAARCFSDSKNTSLYWIDVGAHDVGVPSFNVRSYQVAKLIINGDNTDGVALVQVATPIDLSDDYANDACLFDADKIDELDMNAPKFVFGWGKNGRSPLLSSTLPRYVPGEILTDEQCVSAWGSDSYKSEKHSCFMSSTTDVNVPCIGDDGSPLLVQAVADPTKGLSERLVQTAIFVRRDYFCTEAYPGLFADIAPLKTWIAENIACAVPGANHYPQSCNQS